MNARASAAQLTALNNATKDFVGIDLLHNGRCVLGFKTNLDAFDDIEKLDLKDAGEVCAASGYADVKPEVLAFAAMRFILSLGTPQAGKFYAVSVVGGHAENHPAMVAAAEISRKDWENAQR